MALNLKNLKEEIDKALENISAEDIAKYFPEDKTPKGWVSIYEHLPMWKAVDIMHGGTRYKVKTADGREGYSWVSDHNVWFHEAESIGITHWWNP